MAQPKAAWKVAFWCGPLLLAGVQFAPGPTPSNPPIRPARTIEARMHVPPHIQRLLDRSCKGCHSNATRWPWYSGIAPARWIMAADVEGARSAMNFSEWDARIGPALLAAACANIQSGRMPAPDYLLLHPSARFTAGEKRQFCEWTRALPPEAGLAATR
jgi:hypothetical protein